VIANVADSVGTASAGVSADGIDASTFDRTVGVGRALDLNDRWYNLTGTAAAADISARANADHCAYWQAW
jgi:hypothetical protein